MWFISSKYQVFLVVTVQILTCEIADCSAITNTNLNTSLRDYSKDEGNNKTHVKTLQKEEIGKHAYFIPANNPIKFKEIADSALSSSSHSRGYALNDYEESPHYEYGHDYHFPDPHSDGHHTPSYDHHGYEHHDYDPHHYGGHHGYDHGYNYKHYKHALAAKAVLWPIAGIALLGAAAALVSNPVLLQLGVVSGKRRRRDTEEITGPDFPTESFIKYEEKIKKLTNEAKLKAENPVNLKKRVLKTESIKEHRLSNQNLKGVLKETDVKQVARVKKVRTPLKTSLDKPTNAGRYDKDDDGFIPIPLKLRSPKISESRKTKVEHTLYK
ncbi:uncharacterized protein LOC142977270 isoform X2 [Anticarsia gemmatalis]|uniref:uncharacterized protein LOC142977270 isoform X2 n=1 Tax=Anticarsia gemmatalis TaxID=129554 RepID=UPI003F7693DF